MKRGQITLFIIIGIIILLVIGLFLYLTREREVKRIEAARPKIVEVPEDVKPINEFVLTCLSQLTKDGVKKLGDYGGYTNTQTLNYYPYFPTRGNAVQFSPSSDMITAYWWHMTSQDACRELCKFATGRPPLYRGEGFSSFESQIDNYITENLDECLGGFESFVEQDFTVTPKGTPKVETTIAQGDLFVTLEYPLHITRGEVSYDIKDFAAELDVRLREIHELATDITNIQIENGFIEQATLTLIDLFSEADSSMLPPPSDFEISSATRGEFWIKHRVKENLKRIIQTYIPFMQVWGVRNYKYVFSPYDTQDKEFFEILYNRFFFWPLNATHPELEARFQYLDWWEPYFNLNCKGELCQPDTFSMSFPISLGVKRYDFTYDLSFPVLVEINQPSAFKGEGYSFKFFLETNIRHNEPFTSDAKLYSSGRIPIVLMCNPNQRTSGNVSIFVQDGYTGQGVDEAAVEFACGETVCAMGITANGTFESQFPRCIGGLLTVSKPGYDATAELFDTDTDENVSLTMTLYPRKEVDFTVKQWYITKPSKWGFWKFDQTLGLLSPRQNQSTIIMLTRQTDAYTKPFVALGEISPGQEDLSKDIALVPGKYDVKIISMLYDNVTIPVDYRCEEYKKQWYSTKKSKKCYFVPEEPIVFDEENPFFYGGAEFVWEVTPNELVGAKEIEFRQIVLGLDRIEPGERIAEDLSQMEKIFAYSKAYAHLLKPVVK